MFSREYHFGNPLSVYPPLWLSAEKIPAMKVPLLGLEVCGSAHRQSGQKVGAHAVDPTEPAVDHSSSSRESFWENSSPEWIVASGGFGRTATVTALA